VLGLVPGSRVDRGLEVLLEVGVEIYLPKPNELAYSDEPNAPLVDQPAHQPGRHAESLSGGFDG
jgi:hypothetical protein